MNHLIGRILVHRLCPKNGVVEVATVFGSTHKCSAYLFELGPDVDPDVERVYVASGQGNTEDEALQALLDNLNRVPSQL